VRDMMISAILDMTRRSRSVQVITFARTPTMWLHS